MHIPDGFLDPWVLAGCFVLAAAAIGFSSWRLNGRLDGARVPLLGVVSAGIFAAQMLNWPIPGGTSAHFVGGAFAAILLGPYLGCLAMASVVVVQAFVFGDGGVLALGANLLNMAVVDVFVGYALFRALVGLGETIAAFVAGWGAITVSAAAVGLQAGLSSTFAYDLATTLTVMTAGHAVLGLVEGLITVLVVRYLLDVRPDLVLGLTGPNTGGDRLEEATV
ncbi:energy-coupling factor ABC transporter permease [Salinigranum halophilum]|jgi:cobalt/nickel transport system permease protein|uniref:energy-coupling factor ABC transporter permease n=1 Tax=Salinigranum halophilum TaxID=2565931 RepID=UPI0010A7ECAE|nr:energy-coupling factor ABC transporter permease [Salinigranum halophilum]